VQSVSGVGTTGQVLTSNGSGALPTWQTGGSSYTFADSLVNTSGTVTLSGDSASPAASSYYGTNGSSVLGYYALPGSSIAYYNGAYATTSSAYWEASNSTTYGDFTVSGAPALTARQNLNFGTVSAPSPEYPGIAFTAPYTGTIRVSMYANITLPDAAGVTMGLQLYESTTATVIDNKSLTNGLSSSTSLVQYYPIECCGYFAVTASTAYQFRARQNSSTGTSTCYLGASSNGDSSLCFRMEYVF
jgi:hypothetical protein